MCVQWRVLLLNMVRHTCSAGNPCDSSSLLGSILCPPTATLLTGNCESQFSGDFTAMADDTFQSAFCLQMPSEGRKRDDVEVLYRSPQHLLSVLSQAVRTNANQCVVCLAARWHRSACRWTMAPIRLSDQEHLRARV